MRKCRKCQAEKPLSEFFSVPKFKCKSCLHIEYLECEKNRQDACKTPAEPKPKRKARKQQTPAEREAKRAARKPRVSMSEEERIAKKREANRQWYVSKCQTD